MSVSQKTVVLHKIVGSPPPHLCKKICVRRFGRLGRRWHQVAINASGNLPTKINGKYSFWPILCNPAPNTQPILHQFVAAWPCYFWRKIQTFLSDQSLARTHATEISQLKLMGNVAYVCISKNKPLNPYPVVLYKIVGSPPPHLCQKVCVHHNGQMTWSVTSGSYTFIWKFPN